jgi:hypothetical protein
MDFDKVDKVLKWCLFLYFFWPVPVIGLSDNLTARTIAFVWTMGGGLLFLIILMAMAALFDRISR